MSKRGREEGETSAETEVPKLTQVATDGPEQQSTGPPTRRLFICRHAERQDHLCPTWAASATRPHDGPITPLGVEQAQALGSFIRNRLAEEKDLKMTRIYSSPLVRTVQTASHVAVALGEFTGPLRVEQGLCEDIDCLRPRMLGTHRHAVLPEEGFPGVKADVEEAPRGVCRPVLLAAGDLMSVWGNIDLEYDSRCPVLHDQAGLEVDPTTSEHCNTAGRVPRAIRLFVDGCDWEAEPVAVFVTHGKVGKTFADQMLGEEVDKMGYCAVAELEYLDNRWQLKKQWVPEQRAETSGKVE